MARLKITRSDKKAEERPLRTAQALPPVSTQAQVKAQIADWIELKGCYAVVTNQNGGVK